MRRRTAVSDLGGQFVIPYSRTVYGTPWIEASWRPIDDRSAREVVWDTLMPMAEVLFAVPLGFIVWFFMRYGLLGFYTIGPNERAVITTFGPMRPCAVCRT